MPLINVRTSLPEVPDAAGLLQELSAALAQQTGKPESYVTVSYTHLRAHET